MSVSAKREAVIMIIGAMGGLIGANALLRPSNPHYSIKASMDSQLDRYNAHAPRVEQDPLDTIFDRTALMMKVKEDKPWNKTYSEKERRL
ncbi:hypothetical protein ACMFMG_006955 [Clarireedia jacksonii]